MANSVYGHKNPGSHKLSNVQSTVVAGSGSIAGATTAFTEIPGLAVSITPVSSSNKVLIMATFCLSLSSATSVVCANLVRGVTNILVGDAHSSNTQCSMSFTDNSSTALRTFTLWYVDSPATTSSTTYQIQVYEPGNTATVYYNQTTTDTNSTACSRGVSSIIAAEILT